VPRGFIYQEYSRIPGVTPRHESVVLWGVREEESLFELTVTPVA